jgi:hypothetical protein
MSTNDVYPGAPSKCNHGNLVLDITSIPTAITVVKDTTSVVPESGGEATYTISVTNDATIPVTLTSLTDDKYGDISQTHPAGQGFLPVTSTTCVVDGNPTTCEVGGSLAVQATCTCQFTGVVPPGDYPGTFTDIASACAVNPTQETPVCRTDDATVPYSDVPQAPALTKTATSVQCQIDATYTVVVTNAAGNDPSPGVLTLNALTDDRCGSITQVHAANTACTGSSTAGVCNEVVSTTCAASQQIAVGSSYTCSFVCRIRSCDTTEINTVTGSATDDEGKTYDPSTVPSLATDSATVVVSVAPA